MPDMDGRDPRAIMLADTDEWEDTSPSIEAQGTIDEPAPDDTGVVIVNKPAETGAPGQSDRFAITFRQPSAATFRPTPKQQPPQARAGTSAHWPPTPRAPAPLRFERASAYTLVPRPASER